MDLNCRALLACMLLIAAIGLNGGSPLAQSAEPSGPSADPDARPYDAQFNGNRQEWENAIRTRNQAQNEYARTRD